MRILHTADWHLGKLFYGSYLTEEQDYVLKTQLLPLIKDEGIDAVVLSGDVYDRSLPPTEAVALFDEMATKITAELKVPFLVISGNHDSAARLSFASRLLASRGLYIAGELDRMTDPVVLDDQYGPVAFLLAPYAEPAVVRHFLGDDNLRSHEAALCALLSWQQEKIPRGMRTVCVAHAFVAGGLAGDSERPLSIGGSDQVGSDLFTAFSYTALGHLHGPQQITVPTIRYSGSLLKYSFGEAQQKKGAVVVDLDGAGKANPVFHEFSPRHDVRIVSGSFADIMAAPDDRTDDFILARLSDNQPILDGMAKLRRKYPNAMALEMPNRNTEGGGQRDFNLRQSTGQELFDSFSKAMRPDQPLTEAEEKCVRQLWEELEKREQGGLS